MKMGNCSSCCEPDEDQYEGDAKRMGQKALDNVKYIKKWEKKYCFIGRLQVEDSKELVEKIEKQSKGSKKRQKKEGSDKEELSFSGHSIQDIGNKMA